MAVHRKPNHVLRRAAPWTSFQSLDDPQFALLCVWTQARRLGLRPDRSDAAPVGTESQPTLLRVDAKQTRTVYLHSERYDDRRMERVSVWQRFRLIHKIKFG